MSRLGDRLRLHARDAADAPAIHAGDRWWSFGELVAAAEALALPAGPGDVVAIAVDRGIEAVLAVCATALAGAIPALIDPHDRALAARRLAGLRPAAVLAAPDDADLPGARVIARPGAPAYAATTAGWDPARRSEAIAHLLFTSGSTADGKGVVWSELRAGYDWMIGAPPRIARGRPAGIVVPLCTSLGYQELTRALYHATSVALLDAPFPAAIAQARELGVDRIRLTPTHVELLLATAEELPALRVVSVTAAPIAPDRLRALAERLPSARIARSYGLTESGVATVVWRHRRPGKLHTVGRAVGHRRVTVRDDTGRMLPPGEAGEVVIDLPVWDACDGYLDAPPELAQRFTNGTLWTGDRGTVDEHGFLILGARAAEILKVGGRSVGAPRVEEVLAALPGVTEVAVVGVPDRVLGEVPCAVFVPAAGGDPQRIADHAAAAEVRPDELPRWLLARRELPRGPSGKLRRGVLAEEAARWARSFGRAIVVDHRRYPAFDLESGVAVVDGCPASWTDDPAGLDPAARIIALASRRPPGPLALAVVQAGAADTSDAVRFVVGPVAAELADDRVTDDLLDVFAGELIVLAGLLPGSRPALTCVFSPHPRAALSGAGFTAIPGHPGWMRRPQGEASPAVIDTALRELAAVATRLSDWMQRGATP
jgi:acyl-coenzyme A synthetase/AMP-(fatty) acid ligase